MPIIKAAGKFYEAEINGEIVLMDAESGNFFGLDTTGLAIWKLLDQHDSIDMLKQALLKDYLVSEADCDTAISQFIAELERAGFVIVD